MTNVYFESVADSETFRHQLYAGDIHILSASDETKALVGWARELTEEAFAPYDPLTAQYHVELRDFADRLSALKPHFIHHPKTWELLRAVVIRHMQDPMLTYLDVPRLRGVTSDGFLTSGPGYAFPMHRDTWWSAPLQQINWWLPIYPINSDSTISIHPAWWDRPVANSSGDFDYYDWNLHGRAQSAQNVTSDSRVQPKITQAPLPDPGQSINPVVPEGSMIIFSGQQMHSTVPNVSGKTRFSIDFRTVSIVDVSRGVGAPNIDSAPRGTALRDFRRVIDRGAMPEDLALAIDPRVVDPDAAVFKPPASLQIAAKEG